MSSAGSRALPAELILPFLTAHVEGLEAAGCGWLLEKGPRVVEQFEAWKAAGLFPDKVVVLDCDARVIAERTKGRLQDPVTGALSGYVGVQSWCLGSARRVFRAFPP